MASRQSLTAAQWHILFEHAGGAQALVVNRNHYRNRLKLMRLGYLRGLPQNSKFPTTTRLAKKGSVLVRGVLEKVGYAPADFRQINALAMLRLMRARRMIPDGEMQAIAARTGQPAENTPVVS